MFVAKYGYGPLETSCPVLSLDQKTRDALFALHRAVFPESTEAQARFQIQRGAGTGTVVLIPSLRGNRISSKGDGYRMSLGTKTRLPRSASVEAQVFVKATEATVVIQRTEEPKVIRRGRRGVEKDYRALCIEARRAMLEYAALAGGKMVYARGGEGSVAVLTPANLRLQVEEEVTVLKTMEY